MKCFNTLRFELRSTISIPSMRVQLRNSHEQNWPVRFSKPEWHMRWESSVKNKFSDDPACPFHRSTGLNYLPMRMRAKHKGLYYTWLLLPFVCTRFFICFSFDPMMQANGLSFSVWMCITSLNYYSSDFLAIVSHPSSFDFGWNFERLLPFVWWILFGQWFFF